MEEKKNIAPIDLVAIFKKLRLHRKTYYKVLPATLIITYLITVCVPRYYRCTVRTYRSQHVWVIKFTGRFIRNGFFGKNG